MSTFEPSVAITLLCKSSLVAAQDRESFRTKWDNSVKRRADTWSNLPESRKTSRPRRQLEWESQIVEYVSFIWDKTRLRKKDGVPTPLGVDIPLYGPRFTPPSYLHQSKRSGVLDIRPEVQYLKPVNIVHPFYYPELACCPQCQSHTDVTWDGWTGTGARELHGISEEETALGLQLRCKSCKSKKSNKANTANNNASGSAVSQSLPQVDDTAVAPSSNYCWATTSIMYWKSWELWNIPLGVPIFLHRCGLTRDLFDFIIAARPSTTIGGLAENIKQLHLLEYHRRKLEYLSKLSEVTAGPKPVDPSLGTSHNQIQAFSAFDDPRGFAGCSISAGIITEVYSDFAARVSECKSLYMSLSTGGT